jgi:hypothetical protein
VRYTLDYADDARDHLLNLPLSRLGRLRLHLALVDGAMTVPDSFRCDPANRCGPASCYYHFRHIFRDGGRYWTLYFVVDDSSATYGILRVVYADCQ